MDRSNLPIDTINRIVKILCEKLLYSGNVLFKKIGLSIKNPKDQPKFWRQQHIHQYTENKQPTQDLI